MDTSALAPLNKQDENIYRTEFKPVNPAAGGRHGWEVPDAHVAAILFQHGDRTIYTNDRDFRKFQSLDVRDPFS